MRISDWSSDVCSSDLPLERASSVALAAHPRLGGGRCGFWAVLEAADGFLPRTPDWGWTVRIYCRNGIGLPVRRARHRADRAPCRLHRLMAGGAARGSSRPLPRIHRRATARRLAALTPPP